MAVRIRPARGSFKSRAYNGDARPDNRLALADQALFAQYRATGQENVIQVVWLYEHAIDFDGLRRFHHNLGHGLLGRRIERSPLPFGRHRWVLDRGPADIDIAECARPRAELSDWADERSQLPADPESGPGWHLGVLPLTDGSTAVSLVVSHCLVDGLGLVLALAEALMGYTRDFGYPPPRSRSRLRAVVQDARQTVQDAPEVGRALVTAAKLARKQAAGRRESARPMASLPLDHRGSDGDDVVVVPGVTIDIDLDDWDACAKALGGTPNTLLAALAAKLGERAGRRRANDGAVTVQFPVSERTEGDTRANALSFARVSIDPTRVTTDLRDLRAAIKHTLSTVRETPDKSSQILWLTLFMPQRMLKRLFAAGFSDPNLPVFCSNLGEMGSVVCRLDGTDAEYGWARVTGQHVTRQSLERIGGQMILQSLHAGPSPPYRLSGKILITVLAYQPGAENTTSALRELAARVVAEFDLTGKIE